MATIVTRAGKGSALTWVEADANFTNLNTAKLEHIVSDLTPQLGANLDVNGHSIVSLSNGDINITPNGTGVVLLKGVKFGPGAGSVSSNTAGGNLSLSSNTTGANNTSFGYQAMQNNSNGNRNTAFGQGALFRNANNSDNSAFGQNALNNAVNGQNTAIGRLAGGILDTGTTNTFLGYNSGSAVATGSYNVILGSNTGSTISGTSNNIIISDGQGNIRLQVSSTGLTTFGGNIDVQSNTISSSTGNVQIPDTVSLNNIIFDTTNILAPTSVGQLVYNADTGGLELLMKNGNVNLQIGQELLVLVQNQTGTAFTDGQIVYISGAQGQQPTVALASASAELTSSKTLGMVTEPIANGALGYITTHGLVNGLNTIAYSAGTPLWLDTTAGLYTSTRPSAPNHGVFIGWVIRSHATSGSIYVNIQNGVELDELHDVYINALSDGQLLKYNGTTSRWENFNPTYLSSSDIGSTVQAYDSDLTSWAAITPSSKQDTLISGTNIKSINSTSLLGSGNISVQDVLVSGTNIKTVNGNNLLGSGNIVITAGQGLGQITAYKADGSQDNIDITANTTLTQIGVTQELLLDASSLIAIETTSSYGWRDNIAPFVVKATTGTNNPSWAALWSGIEGLVFSATSMNQVWVDFHIDHDYALGTNLYPHVHWTPTTTGTGVVRWGIEYSVAKGHQQGSTSVFPTSTTVYVEQTISTASQWMHFVAEVSDANAIPSTNVEPDTVIKVRIFRDAAHANDTYTGTVHAWQSDLHYKSNRFATLNKAPSFNG